MLMHLVVHVIQSEYIASELVDYRMASKGDWLNRPARQPADCDVYSPGSAGVSVQP